MKHDILGKIDKPEGDEIDGIATIEYGSRNIEVQIVRDDQPFETTVHLAAEVVRRLAELDKAAKRIAVAELRDIYNSGWNEYDEVQEDGSLKSISNPQLSEAEFEEKLSLDGVSVTGDREVLFFYGDEGMFWGHSVIVHSPNGLDLNDAHAELFG